MSDDKYVSTSDLMKRIDELEAKLIKQEPESLSSKMMKQAQAARNRNTVTMSASSIFGDPTRSETKNVTEQIRKVAAGERDRRTINDQLRKAGRGY